MGLKFKRDVWTRDINLGQSDINIVAKGHGTNELSQEVNVDKEKKIWPHDWLLGHSNVKKLRS